MDEIEARKTLSKEVEKLRKLSYAKVLEWLQERGSDCISVQGESGTVYQIEISTSWANKDHQDILVSVSIDDGHMPAAFIPPTEMFFIAPDNSIRDC
jgi:hypothetical protein